MCIDDRSDSIIPASPRPAHGAGRSRQGRVHVVFTVSSLQSCALVRNNTAGLTAQGRPEEKKGERVRWRGWEREKQTVRLPVHK